MKFQIYSTQKTKESMTKLFAFPYSHNTEPEMCCYFQKNQHKISYLSEKLEHSEIYDQKAAFYSKAFFAKFDEDEILFNELCQFRLELEAYP